jgi:hypothetical protein
MFMTLNVLNLDGYAVERFRHNHSTWIVMPLNMFSINIQLRCFMPLNMFVINIQLRCLRR